VRMIAVGSAKRTPLMPDVPTIAEAGLPGLVVKAEVGFLAPAGTPRDVITKLNSEIARVLAAPDVVQRMSALGIDTIGSTPQQYAESIRADMQSYAKLVKDARLRVD